MSEKYAITWKEQVTNYPKLRTYLDFKDNWKEENYLKMSLNRRERSILSQTRFGILPIRIETGRFMGEKLEDRICVFCNLNMVESEYHYIYHCPFYREIRMNTLGFHKLSNLISEKQASVIIMNNQTRNLIRFLCAAGDKRNKAIFE